MSDAKRQANARYVAAKIDAMNIKFPRGTREKVQALSTMAGQSMAQYVLQAIKERCARDGIDWDTLDNPSQL